MADCWALVQAWLQIDGLVGVAAVVEVCEPVLRDSVEIFEW